MYSTPNLSIHMYGTAIYGTILARRPTAKQPENFQQRINTVLIMDLRSFEIRFVQFRFDSKVKG